MQAFLLKNPPWNQNFSIQTHHWNKFIDKIACVLQMLT